MLLTEHEDTGLLSIAGSLDIASADLLCQALRRHIERYPEPALDISALEGCDTACLQLLWAARRTATHYRKLLRVTTGSDAVRQAAATLGLALNELEGESSRGI
jgi:anti-anti-sigma regulatory factor